MRRFSRFNHSTCKTVLNLLEAVSLRLRKIVVERVTVVKFRVDNRGSKGTKNSDQQRNAVCSPKQPHVKSSVLNIHGVRYGSNSHSTVRVR